MASLIQLLGVVLLLCSLATCDSSARHLTQEGNSAVHIDEENASEFVELASSLSRGDEIVLAAGITIELNEDLEISTKRVTIRGEGQNENKPIIQCTRTSTRILITEMGVRLTNFMIRNCKGLEIEIGSSSGNSSFEVELVGVDFVENVGTESTALGLGSGSLLIGVGTSVTISNCSFQGNKADYGGAMMIREPARVNISGSEFKGNRGGAIWTDNSASEEANNAFRSALIVSDSTFVRNEHTGSLGTGLHGEVVGTRGGLLESSVFIEFTAPSGAAGAIFASGVAEVEIKRCRFRRNGALYLGAVTLSDNGNILIVNSTFIRNSPRSEDKKAAFGGAIYYQQTDGDAGSITIDNSSFIGNRAGAGGAVHALGTSIANMQIIKSSFLRNQAASYGGALIIRNFEITMRATEFIENTAHSGGAMAIVNGGGLRIAAGFFHTGLTSEDRLSEFLNNNATDGGALFLSGTSTVHISEGRFIENIAERDGGAVCVIHTLSGSSTAFRTCTFRSNHAQRGGAYFGSGASSVSFTSSDGGTGDDQLERGRLSEDKRALNRGFYWNTALAGGALYVSASNPFQNRLILRGVTFEGNEALEALNQTTSKEDNARSSYLDVLGDDPCYPGGGGVMCLVLTDISPRAQSQYEFRDSNFISNSASVGGALLIATTGIWNTSFPSSGSDSTGNAILLQKLMFQDNTAKGAGGALFSTFPKDVLYTDDDDVENAYSLKDLTLPNPSFEGNSVHRGGYGPQVASLANALRMTSPESNLTNLESGVDTADIEIRLVDALNQTVTDGVMDASMHLSVYSREGIASGGLQSVVQKGYARFGVIITASPGDHQITIHGNRDEMDLPVHVSTRGCYIGEYNIKNLLCGLCGEGSFTLDTNMDCQTCPTHGNCTGGAGLAPVEGYWHSTPFSPVMHDCLEFEACAYQGRQEILTEFYSKEASGGNLTVIAEPFDEEYPQCRKGYHGVLCGSCTADYGHVANGKCKSCTNESRTRFLVIFSGIWMLILMTFTIRSALISIRDFIAVKSHALHSANIAQNNTTPTSPNIGCTAVAGQVLQLPQRNGSITSQSGSDSLSSSPTFRRQGVQQTGATNGNNAMLNSPPGPGILNSPAPQAANLPPTAPIDHILAAEKVAETIKIFTNFLQITSVGIVINIEWTEVIKQMLTINDGIAGFSNGSSIAPMECIVGGSQGDRSIRHAILRIFMPVMLMLITMCVFALHWLRLRAKHNKPFAYLRSRIIICALVASFFSYHKITEHLMRILNCMYLDHGEDLSNERCPACRFYEDYAIARDYYWAEDTAHKCFEGKHAKLAYFLGFPGLILFSLGVPLTILWTLVYNKVHDRLHDIQVLNSFGFVYQNYKDRFMFWEVLIMCRKAAVGAIVVFAYSLGGNLQSVMILGTLLIALLSQISAFPFNDYTLNVLETSSLLVSILTFYFAIVFNDPNTSDYAKRAFSVILLLLTVLLVVAFFAVLVFNMDAFVEAKLKQMGHSVPHGRLQRPFKLAKVVTTRVYVSLTDKYNRHWTVIRENRRRRREARNQRKAARTSVGRNMNGSQPLPSPPSTPSQDTGSYHTTVEINPSI